MMTEPMLIDPLAVASRPHRKLSSMLQTELSAQGVGKAIVVLEPDAALMSSGMPFEHAAHAVADAFVLEDDSPTAMLARAMPAARAKWSAAARRHGIIPIDGDAAAAESRPRARLYAELGVMVGDVRIDGAMRLADDPRVKFVGSATAFSLIRPRVESPAKLARTTTWGIEALKIPALWAAGFDGRGVLVGHLDTGADGKHPALAGAIEHFVFVTEAGLPGGTGPAYDTDIHGTHTAATIAGRPVNGRHVGVAPGAKLAVATVIEGGQVADRVLTGLSWALARGVKVISMSLGFRGYVPDFYTVLQRVRERGVLAVVAAGNEGPGTSRSPGNYDNVLSVGATTEAGTVPDFSSSQHFARPVRPNVPYVAAPGDNVISAAPGNQWKALSGTSMATPHVAGLAAILWQAKPAATVLEIEQAILGSAKLGKMPAERAGAGLPDAVIAFQKLTGHALPKAAAPARPRGKKSAKKSAKKSVRKDGARKAAKNAKKGAANSRTTSRGPKRASARTKSSRM